MKLLSVLWYFAVEPADDDEDSHDLGDETLKDPYREPSHPSSVTPVSGTV